MKRILVVEDDSSLREGLAISLKSSECEVIAADSISAAWKKVNENKFDLILLDCNLPDGNGVDFCSAITGESDIPVIFLTALDSEVDEVRGFRAGGCDYIKKPFSLMVLRERINSALNRKKGRGECYSDGKYYFNFTEMVFEADGEKITLSPAEQKLLRILTKNKNQIIPRRVLTEKIWDCESEFIDENALSVTVKRLRGKLGGDCVKTAYGLGYMWRGEGE